jgi:hypothetical protein
VEARDTRDQMRQLNDQYSCTRRIMVWTVQLEPASSWFERPADNGMVTDKSSFKDFYDAHGDSRADTYSSLGYKLDNYFGDERDQGSIADFERHLQHFKCMEFCFLAADPRDYNRPEMGRKHCFDRRSQLAERRGTKLPTLPIADGHDYFDALQEEQQLRGKKPRLSWV